MTNPRSIPDFTDPAQAAENKRKYRSFDHEKLHAPFYKVLRAMLDEAKARGTLTRVLDVGSGTGENAHIMAQLGAFVVAVEPASEMRRLGEDLYAHPRIQLVDDTLPSLSTIRACTADDNKFDAVLMSATLQYVAPHDLKEALEAIAVISRPGGMIRITYPTPPSRQDQFPISPERFKQAVEEANAALPESVRLQLTHEAISPASDGRKALSKEPLYFVEFTLIVPSRGPTTKPRGLNALFAMATSTA